MMGGTAYEDRDDPTVYPEEEPLGEEMLQRWISEVLRPLLERHLNGEDAEAPYFVGADQFIYYRKHDPVRRFAPDIYVLPGLSPDTRVRSWKTWVDGPCPPFVLEVVSSNWRKDYEEMPAICDEAGVSELIVFDPSFSERPGGEGARFQTYRRSETGTLERVDRHDGDRTWSESLGLWLRTAGFGDRTRLRIASGIDGEEMIPTAEEAERAEKEAERAEKEVERAAKEAERAAKEVERAAKEVERAEKEAALERVRQLEARLRTLDPDE